MAIHKDREAFIPYRRADVVELCLLDGKLQGENVGKFREFCEILSAYYHFDFHKRLESLKNNFAPVNPDADTRPMASPTPAQIEAMSNKVVEQLEDILGRANYSKLTQEEWEKAKEQESLITLRMKIDFHDFKRWILYHRGSSQATTTVKKLFWKKEFILDIYERVVLLLTFQDEAYFKAKGSKISDLNFTPGKTYIYFYKKIPRADLEVLFPNVAVSMNWLDKLLFWIPAIGAGLYTMFKVFASLVLLIGALLFLFNLEEFSRLLGVVLTSKEEALACLAGVASALVVLGGFAFRQYVKYKNKRLKFLKDITDTLFFRNLDCNAGVFHRLIDEAEEEECKENIIAYYHLLTHPEGMTQERLDDCIEEWLEQKFHAKIDFAVGKAIHRLQQLQGNIAVTGQSMANVPILRQDARKICRVASLDEAKAILDHVWDKIYNY